MNENYTKSKKEKIAYIILFIVALIWGGGFVAGKMALVTLSPMVVIAERFLTSALLCGIFFWKTISHTSKDTIKKGLLIGTVQFLAFACQLYGLDYTTPAKQSFLCTAYVAIVPFMSWIVLKKKPDFRAFIAGILAIVGIGLISIRESFTLGFGDSLSLGFALLFAVQIVLVGRFVGNDADSFQLSFFQFLTVGLMALIICTITGESGYFVFSGESLVGILYLAVLNTFVAIVAQNYAQKYAKDVITSLIISLESVFGFIFSVIYYDESVSAKVAFGAILCFIAILLNTVRRKKHGEN